MTTPRCIIGYQQTAHTCMCICNRDSRANLFCTLYILPSCTKLIKASMANLFCAMYVPPLLQSLSKLMLHMRMFQCVLCLYPTKVLDLMIHFEQPYINGMSPKLFFK